MKKMRKIASLLLAVVMIFAMSATTFAASITITRDETHEGTTGRNYNAYKIFDAAYVEEIEGTNTQNNKVPAYGDFANANVAYSMAINSEWLTVMQEADQTWFDVKLAADGSAYIVTLKEGIANNEATAKAFAAYLNNNVTGKTSTEITPGTAATVDKGYYLIVASDGATNLTLVTTDVEIVEKNTYIVTTKTTAQTSYNVGDTVAYTVTVTVPADTKVGDPIILHDVMDSALTFDIESVVATIDGVEFEGFTVDNTNPEDGCTFEVSIPVTEDVKEEILGREIIFTYEAEVNSTAATETGLVNKLWGEKNGYITLPDEVKVWTFDFDFNKTFNGSEDTNLTATFELRTDADDETTAISFITKDGGYIVADSDDQNKITLITATNNSPLNINGLKAGTYYLVEKSTSTGYNLLNAPVEVVIEDTTAEGVIDHIVKQDGEEVNAVGVVNNAGTLLPSTGGMGTTILYVVGGILVVAAVVLLFVKRRVEEN